MDPRRRAALAIKRLIDVLVAALGIAALAPVLALLTLLEVVFHGWPPMFVQERPGLDERIFRMLKFRTMSNARGPDGELLPDEQRLTRFGQLLRSTSLDEIPELINVLRGDMSLVGPRPLLVKYLPLYNERQRLRHTVRPGITGWAAVNGRNSSTWEERFENDVWYVENWSLGLDLRILARTVGTVLRREGIAEDGSVTKPNFRGSPPLADATPKPAHAQ
ncbi:MAG: sugar transferase [Myxococcales bacterium]|nr:sugar transferase [Myxococcales bacterium]MCB9531960.1 sugar transferase [Myxococcales bacterium]MCB9532827.1 sugar transferase [Myxococcales bacterium]